MVELTRMSIARPFVHLLLMGLVVVAGCPSDCICKWKGGKQNVECVNRSLRTFPPTIDPGTQVLDVSGNSFETLPPDHFMRSGLINLQKIYLSRCRLSHINSRAFRGLSNLVDLDLGHNLLREVPTASFPDCPGLMRLILSGNPIPHIPKRAFVSLQSLTTLELSHSGIEVIEHGAFEGLHSLEWLKLSGNRLRRVGGLGVLPLGLKGVWLEDNPWQCDCGLVELRLWLGERNVANSVEPRCQGPDRLTNLTIRELPADNFACTPQLSPTTMFQKIGEGKNVSLLCKVSSVPESSLEWLFNGQPLSNASLNLLVETSGAYPVGSLLSSQPLLPPSSANNVPLSISTPSLASTPVEKKSELLILNATSDENGTFLCVARNPAGTAMANFTVRVLTKSEAEQTSPDYLGPIPLFVSSYPNLFIIVLSTVAVIGLVIVVFALSLLVCKCSRLCSKDRRGRRRSSSRSSIGSGSGGTGRGGGGDSRNGKKGKGLYGNNGRGGGSGLDGDTKDLCGAGGVVSICGGGARDKLDRHLSETSTLTTHTKSNGSVFLLSTSSELGLGDSNPDLIEGVNNKRVDGDGHETSFNNFMGSSVYCSSSDVVPQSYTPSSSVGPGGGPLVSTNTKGGGRTPGGGASVILEPSQFNPYPADYGLPTSTTGVHVATSTLVRRSPSCPLGGTSSSTNASSYDLAKYPKEYISPQPHHPNSSYGYNTSQQSPGLPPPPHLMYSPADFYPTYILPPGTYVTTYSGPGGEEYAAIATMGGYQLQPSPTNNPVISSVSPTSPMVVPCSCAPILEANEPPESDQQSSSLLPHHSHPPTTNNAATTTTATSPILSSSNNKSRHESKSLMKDGSGPSSKSEGVKSGGSEGGGGSNIARIQRQLTTQINESPDEGYEDEGAEGTEI